MSREDQGILCFEGGLCCWGHSWEPHLLIHRGNSWCLSSLPTLETPAWPKPSRSILGLVPKDDVSCANNVRLCSKGEISKGLKGARQAKAGRDTHTHINGHSSIFGNISKLGSTLRSGNSRINGKNVIVTPLDASSQGNSWTTATHKGWMHLTNWKRSATHTPDKRWISLLYQEFLPVVTRKTKISVETWFREQEI